MDPAYYEEGNRRGELPRQPHDQRHNHHHQPHQHQPHHQQPPRGPPPMSHRPPPGFAERRYGHPSNRPRGPPNPQYHMDTREAPRPRDTYYGEFSYSDYAEENANTTHDQWPLAARPRPSPSPGPNPNHARRPPRRPQRPPMQNTLPMSMVHPAERHNRPNARGEWTSDHSQPPYAMHSAPGPHRPHRGPPQMPRDGYVQHRPPPSAPRSARRAQDVYYQRHASVQSIAEEADSPDLSGGAIQRPISPDSVYDTPPPEMNFHNEPVAEQFHSGSPPTDDAFTADSYPTSPEHERGWSPDVAEPSIVRQASLGKKTRPTLTTVRNGDRSRHQASRSREAAEIPSDTVTPEEHEVQRQDSVTVPANAAFTSVANHETSVPPPLPPPPVMLSPQPSSGAVTDRTESSEVLAPRTYSSRDGRVALSNAAETRFSESTSTSQESSLDEKEIELVAVSPQGRPTSRTPRAPLRIDVDAVRDAEARGSLTSLPDLIRRATRVAANLDRGKTASRLGLEWFLNASDTSGGNTPAKRKSQAGSLSDMLDSFPPPAAVAGSDPSAVRRSFGQMSAHLAGNHHARHAALGSDSGGEDAPYAATRRRGRRCCGLPLWGFWLLVVLLVVLVAAAVLVPVMLLVVVAPHTSHSRVAARQLLASSV